MSNDQCIFTAKKKIAFLFLSINLHNICEDLHEHVSQLLAIYKMKIPVRNLPKYTAHLTSTILSLWNYTFKSSMPGDLSFIARLMAALLQTARLGNISSVRPQETDPCIANFHLLISFKIQHPYVAFQ